MKKTLLTFTGSAGLLLLPSLLSATTPAASIRFAPEAGTTVTKRFTTVTEMSLDELDMLMNGEDAGAMMPQIDMDLTMEQGLLIKDTYIESADGRPVQLSRHFAEVGQDTTMDMSMEMMGETQEQSQDMPATSDLEGTTVLFSWDADGEEYEKEFAEDSAGEDEDMLDGLAEDMDLRCLLPSGDVSEGDEWDIPMENLVDFLAPGGDLSWDVEIEGMDSMAGMGGNPEMMSNLREMMGDIEGEARAQFTGMESGMAVIEITIQIDTAQDMTELMEAAMAESPSPMMPSIDRVDIELEVEGRGKMLWNTRAGHVGSVAFEAEMAVAMDMEMSLDTGQAPMTIETSFAMSGTIESAVETE